MVKYCKKCKSTKNLYQCIMNNKLVTYNICKNCRINQIRQLGLSNKNKKRSEETKKKISENCKGTNGWTKGLKRGSMKKETKLKISNSNLGKYSKSLPGKLNPFFGKKHSKEALGKISEAAKLRVKKLGKVNGKYIFPNKGKNETIALDEISKKLKINIERQFRVLTYFVDGYDKENNVVYEVYENYHNKQIIKDNERMEKIINKLKCGFVIIYDGGLY